MRLEKLKTQKNAPHCHNGCIRGQGNMKMPRLASHRLWLLGHATYICRECALGPDSMVKAYEGAIGESKVAA